MNLLPIKTRGTVEKPGVFARNSSISFWVHPVEGFKMSTKINFRPFSLRRFFTLMHQGHCSLPKITKVFRSVFLNHLSKEEGEGKGNDGEDGYPRKGGGGGENGRLAEGEETAVR